MLIKGSQVQIACKRSCFRNKNITFQQVHSFTIFPMSLSILSLNCYVCMTISAVSTDDHVCPQVYWHGLPATCLTIAYKRWGFGSKTSEAQGQTHTLYFNRNDNDFLPNSSLETDVPSTAPRSELPCKLG